jgi:hypothetical protein
MRTRAGLNSLAVGMFAAGLSAGGASLGLAGEAAFCVTCERPDQTYVCRVNGEEIARNDALKLYCVVRLAKEGSHASCSARDEVSGCNGTEKTFAYNGPSIPSGLADDPRVKKLIERVSSDQTKFRDPDKRKSLVEVTGNAVSASRRGIRNMRASLGGEASQSTAATPSPTAASPSASTSAQPLPELPSARAAPLPTGAMPMPHAQSAALSPDIISAPPEHRSRVRRGAQSVGHFARNSYHCVIALFRHCRSEPESNQPN